MFTPLHHKTMKNILLILIMCLSSTHTYAGEYSEKLNRCFADSTTGRDRTQLAQWVFTGMAAHPDMAKLTSISSEVRDSGNKAVGLLFTHLFAETCTEELKAAMQYEGESVLRGGFEFLGKLAMQELMTNPQVSAAFNGPEKYIDQNRLRAAMLSK
jgi:hypothetical protein